MCVSQKTIMEQNHLSRQESRRLIFCSSINRDIWVILVNMEISVILGHEKTKIRNIIDYGKIDVFSVRTIIHIKNKMMGHLI